MTTIRSDPNSAGGKPNSTETTKRCKALTNFIHRPVPASMDKDAYHFFCSYDVIAFVSSRY